MSLQTPDEAKAHFLKIHEAADFILLQTNLRPKHALVLGTGLGALTDEMDGDVSIPYGEIPGFGTSTVAGHAGMLHLGRLSDIEVALLDGRLHLYEGYDPVAVAFPIRVLKVMGIKDLIITNAAGGLNPHFRSGEIMMICDQINCTGKDPLIGVNLDGIGPRFPDMTGAYDRELREIADAEAKALGIRLNRGVYIGTTGPALETPAETRMLKLLGGDATGMSTIIEVIAAVHAGIQVLGFSVISNVNLPDAMEPILIDDIIRAAGKASPDLIRLIRGVLVRMAEREKNE
jgi:purine-nucleoside phosphorylase